MPEYNGTIFNKQLNWVRPDLLEKWLIKNAGLWFTAKLELIGKAEDPKTAEQLGYYWGLLFPETHRQMQEDGITEKVDVYGIEAEIPITEHTAHEVLTVLCGRVGPNGESLRLSEMDKYQTNKFIDNVLDHAIRKMLMNEKALKAKRPVTAPDEELRT